MSSPVKQPTTQSSLFWLPKETPSNRHNSFMGNYAQIFQSQYSALWVYLTDHQECFPVLRGIVLRVTRKTQKMKITNRHYNTIIQDSF